MALLYDIITPVVPAEKWATFTHCFQHTLTLHLHLPSCNTIQTYLSSSVSLVWNSFSLPSILGQCRTVMVRFVAIYNLSPSSDQQALRSCPNLDKDNHRIQHGWRIDITQWLSYIHISFREINKGDA